MRDVHSVGSTHTIVSVPLFFVDFLKNIADSTGGSSDPDVDGLTH